MENVNHILERLSSRAKLALVSAQKLAESLNHPEIGSAHLLYGIVKERSSFASEVVLKRKLTEEQIKEAIVNDQPTRYEPVLRPTVSAELREILEAAAIVAQRNNYQFIGTEHFLYALVERKSEASRVLESLGFVRESVQRSLADIFDNFSRIPELMQQEEEVEETQSMEVPPAFGNNRGNPLAVFTEDLTRAAAAGKIDPVIGRERELARIINILNRRTKNNPLLVGEPGVGKTAIVEGLALAIARQEVPEELIDKNILTLDLALIVAGSMFRGEFENRLKSILDQIRDQKNTILFIDELHTIIGAGATTGSLDAANILKPALARSELTVIGATTYTDYKRYIENDPALERRFQPVFVEEPQVQQTIAMLAGLKPFYEKHHNITIDDSAIESAVTLSHRYINDRFLPDKAIDIIDEAAAGLTKNNPASEPRKELRLLTEQIKKLEDEKAQNVLAQDFGGALKAKLTQDELRKRSETLQKEIEANSKTSQGRLRAEHVLTTIASIANIPLKQLAKTESQRLLHLEKTLRRSIVGQDEVLRTIAETIRRAHAGIASITRPIGSFLFLGPTGVGKTETAKVLAQELFDNANNIIRIDMSEFMERHNVARLLGAAPGYVGFEDGGRLTEAVRRRPYSVVLFDEIEKAHSDVFNILLQILEEGELTDAAGKKVNFKNTIIILTSNLGGGEYQKKKLGFNEAGEQESTDTHTDVLAAMRERLSPELLNRIDSIAVFKPLSRESIKEVVKLELNKFALRLATQGITIKPDAKLINFLHQVSHDPARGARKVRNELQRHVESALSHAMLEGKVKKPATIKFKIEDKRRGLEQKIRIVSV